MNDDIFRTKTLNWPFLHHDLCRWRYHPGSIQPPLTLAWQSKRSKLALAQGEVTGENGLLALLDGSGGVQILDYDGQSVWARKPEQAKDQKTVQAASFLGGRIFVPRLGRLECLDVADGKTIWAIESKSGADISDGKCLSDEHDFAAGILTVSDKGALVVGSSRGAVRWIDPNSGKILSTRMTWANNLSGAGNRVVGRFADDQSGPRVPGMLGADTDKPPSPIDLGDAAGSGHRYCFIDGKIMRAFSKGLLCCDGSSGKVIWSAKYGLSAEDPIDNVMRIATDGTSVFSQREHFVAAYDAESGRSIWRTPYQAGRFRQGEIAATAEHVIVFAVKDRALCFLDKRSGNPVWSDALPLNSFPEKFSIMAGRVFIEDEYSLCCFKGS